MCAIFGTFNKEKLQELYKLNAYRGELSYSIASFRPVKDRVHFQTLFNGEGKLPLSLVFDTPDTPAPIRHGDFIVAHSQAPTTDTQNIHPAVYEDAMLWHNGIIKQKNLPVGIWDTQWLLENILDYGWSVLSRMDGTFACVMYLHGKMYVFRNEISPLFIDDSFNISSTKFEGSKSVPPNNVWLMNFETMYLDSVANFVTFENPYFFFHE